MAARFWVTGGTGNWSSTTNWSATSGGGSGASVPGSADTATFNASSGIGTATVDSNVTIQTLTMTGFAGTLAFGTNSISLNSTGTVYTGDITYTVTGTPVINVTSTGSTAITFSPAAATEANSISFNFIGGTYTLSLGSLTGQSVKNLNFTGFSGTFDNTFTYITCYGNLTFSAGMTLSASANAFQLRATSGTQIITTNTKILDFPINFNGIGGTYQLADAMTLSATRQVTLAVGTLNLNGKTLTTGLFNSSNTNTRTIAFGAGNIICNAAGGTLWTTATITSLTITGTPIVNISNSGAVATTVAPGALTEAQAISFNFTTGTYALTFLGTASHSAKNVNFTGFAGTWSATSTATIYGNLTISTGMSLTASASTMTFGATSGTQIITSNTKTIDFPITFNGVGGTFQLFDNMTLGATRTATLTNGTLDLNGKSLTTGLFASSNSNTRTIAFGTGNITCNAAGGTLWSTPTVTSLTVTGTPVVNISNSGAVATIVNTGALSEANSISFNFINGTYALDFFTNTGHSARNVSFVSAPGATTGFAGTLNARINNNIIYGSLTLSSGMTFGSSSGSITFAATSGTNIITSNTKTIDAPVIFNGVGGTWQLADAFTLATGRGFTITNGTFDGNNKAMSVINGIGSTVAGSNGTLKNIVTTDLLLMTSTSTLNLGGPVSVGATTLTAGTLNLVSYPFTCSSFSSSGSGVRAINFGSGSISVNSTAGGTLWTTATVTNLTVTGTPTVNIVNSGAVATTVASGALSEANSISFNFTTGSYALTFLGTSETARNVVFTGFAGTLAARGLNAKIYGNLILSTGMSITATTNTIFFAATSGTQNITSNGKSLNQPILIACPGATVKILDAFTTGSSRLFSHQDGTLDLNGQTLTIGTSYTTTTGTKSITFNGGTLVCPAATITAFNNAAPAGFTTTAGTGTGKISMTGATAKTFVGGDSTYNCTLSNDGAGALTISGANTFTTIANGVQPTDFVFPISVTQTVTNWTVSGTAGNLVTITSGTAGTAATLSKASGTVSSNYLSLKDSAATGGATWYAGANSTNVSGNSGWIFSNAPANAAGSFFFMF